MALPVPLILEFRYSIVDHLLSLIVAPLSSGPGLLVNVVFR